MSQLVRSPGRLLQTVETDAQSGQRLANAKLIPSRGAWLEFETSAKRILSVKIDRKRKLPVSRAHPHHRRAGPSFPATMTTPPSPSTFAAQKRLDEEGTAAAEKARDAARRECEKVLGT